MVSALFYLQFQQWKNRMRVRLRRLRQPKYLLGALLGAAYFYFNFLRYFWITGGPDRRPGVVPLSAPMLPHLETLGALALAVVALAAWIVPRGRAALVFTEAEIAFLFPAPVSRRALIHFKLLRSQAAILFTILLLTILGGRFRGAGGSVWTHAAGWWVLLSTINLHLLGSSFARTLLLERGVTLWQRRAAVLTLLAALILGLGWWTGQTLPPAPKLAGPHDLGALLRYAAAAADTVPLRWLLAPFRVPLRPFLAADGREFLAAIGPALLLLGLHYAWVIRANVAFEEASLALSRHYARRLADAARTGRGLPAVPARARRAPFRLAPTGPRAVAILWKNLLSAGQLFNWRLGLMAGWLAVIFGLGLGRLGGAAELAGFIAAEFLIIFLFFGSLLVRQDLRQDAAALDLLKTYPLPGWQIVLGELLAPAVILTAVQWILLLLAAGLLLARRPAGAAAAWAAAGAGLALLMPAFNLLSLLIPNAAVLLLPAWFSSTDPGAARGLEAMGQRLIFFFGQMLVLTVAALPAAALGAAVFFLTRLLAGLPLPAAVLLGCVAATLTLLGEVALALAPLGRLFERLDVGAAKE